MKQKYKLVSLILLLLLSFSILNLQTTHAADHTNPYGTNTVDPAPANSIILKLSKGSKTVNFTLEQLKRFKSTNLTINEPFIKRKQTFKVIRLSELFKLVGIVGKDKVQTIALNDYIYTDLASKFTSASGYLAFTRGGIDIPYDQGGPIRIIYPNQSKWAKYLDSWNWSIKEIAVK